MKEPNKYKVCGESTAIHLFDREGRLKAWTWIDTEDLDRVIKWRWSKYNRYAATEIKGYKVMLHHFILRRASFEDGLEIDHINRNPLDNRKSNLRLVTRSINAKNAIMQKNNTTGYKGIYYRKDRDCWRARIQDLEGKRLHLGNFKTKEDAIAARKAAEQELGYI